MQLTASRRIGIDTYVTANTLSDLISTALCSNLSASDIGGSHIFFIHVGATAPNPTNSPLWFCNDPQDQVLKVFATPFDIWLTVGPDRLEIPMRNASSEGTIAKGMLVCATGSSSFFIATNPSLNAIGFVQDTAASGAWAPVAIYGVAYALFQSSVSHAAGTQIEAGQALKAYGCPAGFVAGVNVATASAESGPMFGMWLDRQATPVPSLTAYRAYVWGPKLTS